MQVCTSCGYEANINTSECLNCGAVLSVDSFKQQAENTGDENGRAVLQSDASAERLHELEKQIEDKLSSTKKFLETGNFETALSTYRSLRKDLSDLEKAGIIESALDLLEQSADLLIHQKQKIISWKRRQKPARSCLSNLVGRFVLIPLVILAGIGLFSLFKSPLNFEGITPETNPVAAATPSASLNPTAQTSPTSLPDTNSISAVNVDNVRELFNWSAGEDIVDLAFSPDGTLLASSDSDGTIRVWHIWSKEMILEIPGSYVSFSPDGKWLGVASDSGIALYEFSTGKKNRAFDEGKSYYSVAFSPDGQLITGGTTYGNFYIWSVNDGEKQESSGGIDGEVRWLSFSKDGILLAAASNTKTYIWNMREKKIEREIVFVKNKPFYLGAALDEDGEWYATGTDTGEITIWRVSNAERMAILEDGGLVIGSMHYLTGSNTPEVLVSVNEVNLTFWMIDEYDYSSRSIYVSTPIKSLAVAPENKLIATGGNDGVIHLWGVLP